MLGEILNGHAPSVVFRRIFTTDPTMNNIRLAEMLADEFIELDSLAMELVWHWMGPGKPQGLSDASLDAQLLTLFLDAGYAIAAQKNQDC